MTETYAQYELDKEASLMSFGKKIRNIAKAPGRAGRRALDKFTGKAEVDAAKALRRKINADRVNLKKKLYSDHKASVAAGKATAALNASRMATAKKVAPYVAGAGILATGGAMAAGSNKESEY